MALGKRTRGLVLALIGSLVLLEVVLQVLTWAVWVARAPVPASGAAGGGAMGGDEEVVLCVGDSFTHGIGASTDAGTYPAQLEARLNEQEPARRWRVANCGLSGQNSWDVLRRLDRQLADQKPRWVCVVIGINDRWSRPALHELPPTPQLADADGFRVEARTLRLARLFAHFVRGLVTDKPKAAPPVLTSSPIDQAWVAVQTARYEDAALHFEQAIADGNREDWGAHAALVDAYMRSGQRAKAQARMEVIAQAFARKPSRELAQAWVRALEYLGRNREALALAEKLAPDFADSWELQSAIGQMHALVGDRAAARIALGRAIDLAVNESPSQRGWLHFERARIFACPDPDLALRDLIVSHVLEPTQRERTLGLFRFGPQVFTPAMFVCTLAEVAPSDALRAEVTELYQQIVPGDLPSLAAATASRPATREVASQPTVLASASPPIPERDRIMPIPPSPAVTAQDRERQGPYAGHLAQIVTRSQAAGAQVIIGGYPGDHPFENGVMRMVAQQHRCGSVDVWASLRAALATRPRSALYSTDDAHCSDAGYAIMAGAMADEILRRARAR